MYRVVVSNGSESDTFYIDNERQANLLFFMAKESNIFKRVELHKWIQGYSQIRKWEETNDG